MTDEQAFIQTKLLSLGIQTVFNETLTEVGQNSVVSRCIYSDRLTEHPFVNLLLVTSRQPKADLFHQLKQDKTTRIGDCLVPSSIADAVYTGHKFAREYGEDPDDLIPRRERSIIQELTL